METVLSAAWPRYITPSGYGIETRHLIKEYRRDEWKERNRIRAAETQTEKTSRMQKQGESQLGRRTRLMHSNGKMFENPKEENDDAGSCYRRLRRSSPAGNQQI